MKTKNNIIKAATLAMLFVAGSCGEELLDLQPQTSLSEATAFATPERIELTVAGVYDRAQSGFYAGGAVRGYPFGAAHIEQGDNRGEDVTNTQAFYLITYSNTYDGTTANNDFHFQTLFSLVNRANVVLAGLETAVPAGSLTQAGIDAYKGECRFLRALAYHELLKHFCKPYSDNPTAAAGGMPYRKTAITGAAAAAEALTLGRGTVAENYADIIADLDYAESVLPITRTGSLKISRATKAAAIAIKTRIYQHMNRWADVVTEGNKLAPQAAAPFSPVAATYGTYSLPAAPFTAFTASGSKSNTESIFSIENDVTDNPGVNGALPSVYNTSAAPTSGRALVAISPFIWNQTWFNATDTRKTATFVNINVEATGGGGKGGYFTKKYSDVVGGSDNAPVIRYAEVLLNMAEAIQRQAGAPDPRAFAMYNAVRSRSNAAGTDANYDAITDFATGNGLIQAILNERRIEFLCEGLRWGDVHRLAQDATFNTWGGGIPAKVSSNITNLRPLYTGLPATNATILASAGTRHDALPYSSYKFLWPIPTSETSLNPTLAGQQNPGW
jgi:hypothetical protein